MQDEDPPAPTEGAEVEAVPDGSRRTRQTLGLGERGRTVNLFRTSKTAQREVRSWLPIYEEYAQFRPKTRGDCEDVVRPCPWVSCKHNNFLHVRSEGEAIVLNFPNLEPGDIPPERSCALDVADHGGATLEDVAFVANITRERVRQVQEKALRKLKKSGVQLSEFVEDLEKCTPVTTMGGGHGIGINNRAKPEPAPEPEAEEEDDFTFDGATAVSFLSEHPKANQLIAARMWRAYLRDSEERGISTRKPTQKEMFGKPEVPEECLVVTNIEDSLSVRHNDGMAHEKTKPVNNTLTPDQTKVLEAYREIGGNPNNVRLAAATKLDVGFVTRTRQKLVKAKLAKPSPRGKTPDPDAVKRRKVPNEREAAPKKKRGKKGKRKYVRKVKPITEAAEREEYLADKKARPKPIGGGSMDDVKMTLHATLLRLENEAAKIKQALEVLG